MPVAYSKPQWLQIIYKLKFECLTLITKAVNVLDSIYISNFASYYFPYHTNMPENWYSYFWGFPISLSFFLLLDFLSFISFPIYPDPNYYYNPLNCTLYFENTWFMVLLTPYLSLQLFWYLAVLPDLSIYCFFLYKYTCRVLESAVHRLYILVSTTITSKILAYYIYSVNIYSQ